MVSSLRSVSPLFGKNDQKAAEVEAAKAEADRLGALTPAELAVELMPVFGPEGPKGRGPDGRWRQRGQG